MFNAFTITVQDNMLTASRGIQICRGRLTIGLFWSQIDLPVAGVGVKSPRLSALGMRRRRGRFILSSAETVLSPNHVLILLRKGCGRTSPTLKLPAGDKRLLASAPVDWDCNTAFGFDYLLLLSSGEELRVMFKQSWAAGKERWVEEHGSCWIYVNSTHAVEVFSEDEMLQRRCERDFERARRAASADDQSAPWLGY